MKPKTFNNLLLFALFGVTLGFFGILYEGIVYGPKLLATNSDDGILFWVNFFSKISPLAYYTPWVGLATLVLLVLFFRTSKQNILLKSRLKWASILQITSLAITFYIVTQINFKQSFNNVEQNMDVYGDFFPGEVLLFNILSVIRIVVGAIALTAVFKGYILTQKEQS